MESDSRDPANSSTTSVTTDRFRAIVAVSVVAIVISILGAGFIFAAWSSQQQRETGILRAVIFVVVMAAVSGAGYLLYINQSKPNDTPSPVIGWAAYRPALKSAIIQQSIFLVLGALMLDMGQAFHICMVAAFAHWAMILVVVCGRPQMPTKVDLIVIRWGYIPLMFVVATVGPLVWAPLGRW